MLFYQTLIILPTYVGEYIVNVWKFFLDRLSRFDDAVSNATIRTLYVSVNEVSCLRYSDVLWIRM